MNSDKTNELPSIKIALYSKFIWERKSAKTHIYGWLIRLKSAGRMIRLRWDFVRMAKMAMRKASYTSVTHFMGSGNQSSTPSTHLLPLPFDIESPA